MSNKLMNPGNPGNCPAAKGNSFSCDECDYLMDCVPDWETAVRFYTKDEEEKATKALDDKLKAIRGKEKFTQALKGLK